MATFFWLGVVGGVGVVGVGAVWGGGRAGLCQYSKKYCLLVCKCYSSSLHHVVGLVLNEKVRFWGQMPSWGDKSGFDAEEEQCWSMLFYELIVTYLTWMRMVVEAMEAVVQHQLGTIQFFTAGQTTPESWKVGGCQHCSHPCSSPCSSRPLHLIYLLCIVQLVLPASEKSIG